MTRREAIEFFLSILNDESDDAIDWKKNDEAATALFGHRPTTEDWDRIPDMVEAEA